MLAHLSAVRMPGDAKLHNGSGNPLVVLDFVTGASQKLLEAPDHISNVAVGPKGAIFLTCGADVHSVKR